jgi:PAS domain S-box-containing protein
MGPPVTYVYVVDRDGIVTYCSRGMAALAGRPPEQIIGRPSLDLYVADARPRFLERRDRAWAGEEIESSIRTTLCHADGSLIPVEITVSTMRVDLKSAGRLTFVRTLPAA